MDVNSQTEPAKGPGVLPPPASPLRLSKNLNLWGSEEFPSGTAFRHFGKSLLD